MCHIVEVKFIKISVCDWYLFSNSHFGLKDVSSYKSQGDVVTTSNDEIMC